MSIQINKPGMLSTIQDTGRTGYGRYGISPNGAMDALAHTLANWLVGNDESEATLEITWSGFSAQVIEDSWIAVTGGNLEPFLDDEPLPMWRPVYARKGSRIAFRKVITGCRAYVAVAGGWQVEPVLGSYSTYLRAGIGGWAGRALQEGDRLHSRLDHNILGHNIEETRLHPTAGEQAPGIHAVAGEGAALSPGEDRSEVAANRATDDQSHAHDSQPDHDSVAASNNVVLSETTLILGSKLESEPLLELAQEQAQEQEQEANLHAELNTALNTELNTDPKAELITELTTQPEPVRWMVSYHILPRYNNEVTIRIVAGRQWEDFTESAQEQLLTQQYRVTPQSDRMGYRLSGEPLELKQSMSYLSEAVTQGTIQVPTDGQPIILMADRQTLGGYAKIAQVISLDLPLLAQLAPGAVVRFRLVELEEAQRLYVEWRHELKLLHRMIQLRLSALGLSVDNDK